MVFLESPQSISITTTVNKQPILVKASTLEHPQLRSQPSEQEKLGLGNSKFHRCTLNCSLRLARQIVAMFVWGVTVSTCFLIGQSTFNRGTSVCTLLSSSTTMVNLCNSKSNSNSNSNIKQSPESSLAVAAVLNPQVAYNLGKHGYAILDNFIQDASTLQELSSDVDALRDLGRFRCARVGLDTELNSNIRIAENCFLHNGRQDAYPNIARQATLERLVQLRNELSLLSDDEPLDPELDDLLYVYYPNGGFYARHVDASPGTPTVLRKFSILLYLNTCDWTIDMGGQLRLFVNDTCIDVLPIGGRLVIFESDRIPHQVVETNQPRLVLVGWFNRSPTDSELLEFSGTQ